MGFCLAELFFALEGATTLLGVAFEGVLAGVFLELTGAACLALADGGVLGVEFLDLLPGELDRGVDEFDPLRGDFFPLTGVFDVESFGEATVALEDLKDWDFERDVTLAVCSENVSSNVSLFGLFRASSI